MSEVLQSELARGAAYREQGAIQEAIDVYETLLAAYPEQTEALLGVALCLCQVQRYDLSLSYFQRSLAQGDNGVTSFYYANALQQVGNHEIAILQYLQALLQLPASPEIYNNLGNSYMALRQLEAAGQAFEQAIACHPDYAPAYNNLGNVYQAQGALSQAVAMFDKAITLVPEYHDARYNKAMSLLLRGDYAGAWPLYESRLSRENPIQVTETNLPRWQGQALKSGTLLILAEQGVGDEITFAGLFAEVAARVAHVIVECDARLLPLFSASFANITFMPKGEDFSAADYVIPAGSLFGLLRRAENDFIKGAQAYLKPSLEQTQSIRRYFKAQTNKPLIGISWQSGHQQACDVHSVSLEQLIPILRTSQCAFINVHYAEDPEGLAVPKAQGVELLEQPGYDRRNDFAYTAALLSAMDAIITVDNTIAVFAPALGVTTHVLLPTVPHGFWRLTGKHSPLFPTAHCYRQQTIGDWSQPVEALKQALEAAWPI